MDSEPQPLAIERIRVNNSKLPAFRCHPQSYVIRGGWPFPSPSQVGRDCISSSKEAKKADGCRLDKRESNLGAGPGVAAGDRCRGFQKSQGFPLQNPFKQTEREPDPREGIGTVEDTTGAPQLKR